MKTGRFGIQLIRDFEGCELTSYLCPAGVWTIGFGHTGNDVKPNMTIAQWRADELLVEDLAKFERGVSEAVEVKITQRQFDALVALAFNIGLGAFLKSTLLRRLNMEDYAGAGREFLRWDKANGVTNLGLARRRKAEYELFMRDVEAVA
jgi:lysozyme